MVTTGAVKPLAGEIDIRGHGTAACAAVGVIRHGAVYRAARVTNHLTTPWQVYDYISVPDRRQTRKTAARKRLMFLRVPAKRIVAGWGHSLHAKRIEAENTRKILYQLWKKQKTVLQNETNR